MFFKKKPFFAFGALICMAVLERCFLRTSSSPKKPIITFLQTLCSRKQAPEHKDPGNFTNSSSILVILCRSHQIGSHLFFLYFFPHALG